MGRRHFKMEGLCRVGVTEEEQLDVLGRLERRLSVGTDSQTPQEVPQVNLARGDK